MERQRKTYQLMSIDIGLNCVETYRLYIKMLNTCEELSNVAVHIICSTMLHFNDYLATLQNFCL